MSGTNCKDSPSSISMLRSGNVGFTNKLSATWLTDLGDLVHGHLVPLLLGLCKADHHSGKHLVKRAVHHMVMEKQRRTAGN